VIAKAVFNVLTNVVTSPFRLLGALVGVESEDFGEIEFQAGRATLTPPEREKLVKLAEALAQRPALSLTVPLVTDPEADRTALQVIATEAAIGEAVSVGEQPDQAEELFASRRRRAIETLFSNRFPDESLTAIEETFERPEDPQDPDGDLVVDNAAYLAELRRRLIASVDIGDTELGRLADSRLAAVTAALTTDERIAANRIRRGTAATVSAGDSGWVRVKLEVESGRNADPATPERPPPAAAIFDS
jgi:hypothetical protein